MQLYSVSASTFYPVPYRQVSRQMAPAPLAYAAWSPDALRLSAETKPQPETNYWTPALKIALLATPVAAGVGIGIARSGTAVGGMVGGAIGAAVSVFGLWWAMTVGNPFDRYKPPTDQPPPPKPGV